jgi:hypothetical protein
MPDAEVPKEHLRAIDKDRQVHDFKSPALPDLVRARSPFAPIGVANRDNFGRSRIGFRRYHR